MRGLIGITGFALVVAAAGCMVATAGAGNEARTVVLDIHHSQFSESSITVRRGTTVRFVLNNADPIPHELIVGDQTVQDVHEKGTESHHGERPGEVSVAPGSTTETTVTFDSPGEVLFGCHLPGHWAYGMQGLIEVV